MRVTCVLAALCVVAIPATGWADDVTESIQEALAAYEEGDYAYAKESLDFASQLIAAKKAGQFGGRLPEPISDEWTAGEVETQSAGGLGIAGTIVSRHYEKNDGTSLNMQFITDSPMIAQMGALFTNPALIGAGGGELVRLGRQKAVINQNGEMQFLYDNRVMVQIDGDANREDKVAYGKAAVESLKAP